MSSSPFDTITAVCLLRYDRRARMLSAVRGLCLTIGVAVSLLLLGVFLDWLIVFPDRVRWGMSAAGYVVLFLVTWLGGIRPMIRRSDLRKVAVEMEDAEPTLRHRLLSAVELHDAEGASAGSARLRELGQSRVAERIQSVDLRKLLPSSHVRQNSLYAGGALCVLLGLLMLPGLDFSQRLARVLMPGANLGRISQTQIWIETPSPTSGIVPAEETTPIVASVSGELPDAVHLEYGDDRREEYQPMNAQGDGRYAINLPVGTQPVEYRIHAGNSVTPWHTLTPMPRPSITAFRKVIQFPDYAETDDVVISEPDGDLRVLQGSVVELELTAGEPLASAELTVQWEDGPWQPWELQQVDANRYSARLPVNESGRYRVSLVDAATGFDNPFAPAYRVEAVEDLPPQIELVDSPSQPLLRPASDLVPFGLEVSDELPLATTGYEVSVNGRSWQRRPLESAQSSNSAAIDLSEPVVRSLTAELDLLPLELQVGDTVRLRGLAIDRKGQLSHSSVLEVIIDSPGYDPAAHDAVLDRLAWAEAVNQWTQSLQETSEATADSLEAIAKQAGEEQRQVAAEFEIDALSELVDQSEQVVRQSIQGLAEMTDPVAAAELEQVGRLADVVQTELRDLLPRLDALPVAEDDAAENAKRLRSRFQRLADHARRTNEYVDHFIGFDLSLAYTADIYGLVSLLDSLQPESPENAPWRRLYRYSTLVSSRLKALDTQLVETAGYLPERSQNVATNLRNWISDRRYRLNELLQEATEEEAGGKEQPLRKLMVDVQRELLDKTNTASQDGRLHQVSIDGLRDLDRRSGALHEAVMTLADQLRQMQEAEQAVQSAKDAAEMEPAERHRKQIEKEVDRLAGDLPVRLRRWATLHQLRPNADARYAADAGLASRAVEAVLRRPEGSNALQNPDGEPATHSEVFATIADDYRILEAGHRLVQSLITLDEMIESERWSRDPVVRRFVLPLRWERQRRAIEDAAAALREAKIDREIYEPVDRARREAPQETVARTFSDRRWKRDADGSVFRQLQDVRDKLAAPGEQLQPIMDAARQRIASYVPSIPQLAAHAADALQQTTSNETENQPKKAKRTPAPEDATATDAGSAAAAQREPEAAEANEEAFRQQMQRLLDSLVQHANVADLGTPEGIEQARDADAAIELLKASQDELQQAQAKADAAAPESSAAEPPQAAASDTANAAAELDEAQQRMLDLLKTVEQHFAAERESGASPQQEEPNALMAALREAGLQRQAEQRFEPIEQMVRASQKDPQQLLRALEQELKQNPEMQDALSEISQASVQRVGDTLEAAATEEAEMQRGIESADSEFRDSKKPIVQSLRELSERAAEMERTLVRQAENAATRGQLDAPRQSLQDQRQQLRDAASQARRLNEGALMRDLQETAQEVAETLKQVAGELKATSDEAAAAQKTPAEEDENRRRSVADALKKENQRMREQRVRDAENRLRNVDRELDRAERHLRSTENELKKANEQLRQAERGAEKYPDSDGHRRVVEQRKQHQQRRQQQVEEAKAAAAVAKAKHDRFEEYVEEAKATPQPSLDAANPAAQSAHQLASHAAKLAEQLHREAAQAADMAGADAAPAPPEGHLNDAASKQQMVQQRVEDAANDLARSARHERRLDQQEVAEQLLAQARDVARTARTDVSDAAKWLESATEAAQQREEASAGEAAADDANGSSQGANAAEAQAADAQARQAASTARDSLRQSEQALRQRQQELESLVGGGDAVADGTQPSGAATPQSASPSGRPAGNASPTGAGEPAADPRDPELLAQTLDQLDQQLSGTGESGSDAQLAENPDGPSTTPSYASRLQSAARAQGRQLAQQRAAANAAATQPAAPSMQQQNGQPASGLVSNAAGPGAAADGQQTPAPADRRGDSDWGQLKTMTIENAADGGNDALHRAYRGQLEAYFRVLAERSRQKSSPAN